MFGGVNGDRPSILHPWGPRNFTQNCLKRSIHTFFQVNYCVFNPVQRSTPFFEIRGHIPCHRGTMSAHLLVTTLLPPWSTGHWGIASHRPHLQISEGSIRAHPTVVQTDRCSVQTDRYTHCSECVCACARTGDRLCPRVHHQAFSWLRRCEWALYARPTHASHRRRAAQRDAALRYDGAALREHALAYRLRVHRSVTDRCKHRHSRDESEGGDLAQRLRRLLWCALRESRTWGFARLGGASTLVRSGQAPREVSSVASSWAGSSIQQAAQNGGGRIARNRCSVRCTSEARNRKLIDATRCCIAKDALSIVAPRALD